MLNSKDDKCNGVRSGRAVLPSAHSQQNDCSSGSVLNCYRHLWFVCCYLIFRTAAGADAAILSDDIRQVGGFTILTRSYNWNGEDNMLFRLQRGKQVIVELRAHGISVLSATGSELPRHAGKDIDRQVVDLTGDGVRDLVVQEWNGAVSGGFTYRVYSLGKTPQRLLSIEGAALTGVAANAHELRFQDNTFAYFSDFPPHQIVLPVCLKWKKDRFKVKLARPAVPNKIQFEQLCRDADSLSSRMHFVELIYMGDAKSAMRLASRMQQKKEFLRSFLAQFRKSPFYYQLIPLCDRQAIGDLQRSARD